MRGRGAGGADRVCCADFGAATKYTVAQTGAHVAEGAGLKGTPTFAGIHMHDPSAPPSRRDDLGALGYMLCHLLRGPDAPLPWPVEKLNPF